ncbi:6025_t:CDS:2, partial [Funneliformis geosporum]
TVVVTFQSVIADTSKKEILTIDSEVIHDIKPRQKQKEEITNTPPNICPEINRNLEAERSKKENSSDSLLGVFQRDQSHPIDQE